MGRMGYIFYFKNIFLMTGSSFIWSVIALQYCVSFSCITQWMSYICTHIFSLFSLPPPHSRPTPLGHRRAPRRAPWAIEQAPTSYLLHRVECIYVKATLSVCPNLCFPDCPQSLCLRLYSCPANRLISTQKFLWKLKTKGAFSSKSRIGSLIE